MWTFPSSLARWQRTNSDIMEFSHVSVLLDECIDILKPERGGVFVDCTTGGAGHSFEIAKRLPEGSRLICLDRDGDALAAAEKRLAPYRDRVTLVRSNFCDIASALDGVGVEKIDGALWDLGVSSYQLDEASRGFSYMNPESPLDMRMSRGEGLSAADVLNTYSYEDLRRVISDYGEERFAPRIAREIVNCREKERFSTAGQLVELIMRCIPKASRMKENKHPAKRTFQAIRIEVNRELDVIEPSLREAVSRMNSGARAAVITFHSLEDAIVKHTFAKMADPCECPRDFPVCVCGKKPSVKLVTRKPIIPTDEELSVNPRSRSAKLRGAEKI